MKDEAKYKAIIENLEEQGYTMEEGSAQVIKTYIPAYYASVPSCIEDEVWNTAAVAVKFKKGDETKIVTASICIDKKKVLSIRDSLLDCAFCVSGAIGCGACGASCAASIGATCLLCVAECTGTFYTCCSCLGYSESECTDILIYILRMGTLPPGTTIIPP